MSSGLVRGWDTASEMSETLGAAASTGYANQDFQRRADLARLVAFLRRPGVRRYVVERDVVPERSWP